MGCNCRVVYLWRKIHTVKKNLHLPYQTFALHQRQPLLQAEILSEWWGHSLGRHSHYAHPYHHCSTRAACSTHILHKWFPPSGGNRPGPPWPVCSMGSTHHLHQKTWLHLAFKSLPGSKALLSPPVPSCTVAGREQPGPLPSQLAYHHGACLFPGSLRVHDHWRLEGKIQALALTLLPKVTVKLWAPIPPLTENPAVLTATDKSQARQPELSFHKVLLGPYDGMLELTVSVTLIHQLLGST